MNEDINFAAFINAIREKYRVILAIITVSVLISFYHAFTVTEYFKARIYLLPPEVKHVMPLNVLDTGGGLLLKREIYIFDAYRIFVLNVQSRKMQREFFFKNKLYEHFSEENPETSFNMNFHDKLTFRLDIKIMSREIREEQFLTISFTHSNPVQASQWLNDYIDMVDRSTSQELTESVNGAILNQRDVFKTEIAGKRNLAQKVAADRVTALSEASVIAERLNIIGRDTGAMNQQSIVLGDGSVRSSDTPLYLYGVNALKAEIQTIKDRKSHDPFIPGLRVLEAKVKQLDDLIIDPTNIKTAQIDQKAQVPTSRFSPKRKLIVFLGAFFGVLVSFVYILVTAFIIRRKID